MNCQSLTLLALASLLPAQGTAVTLAEGTTLATLTIREFDEAQMRNPGRIVLRDAELVPIEMTHRTVAQAGRRDRPQLVDRLGLRRIELPAGGRFHRYRVLGGQRWGHLLITASGHAHALAELPGIGASGLADPFTDRVGVAPDGRHAAILAQDGRLWVARLDGGTFVSTGTPVRALAVTGLPQPLSIAPGAASLFYVTADDRVWRCALGDGNQPQNVTPAGPAGSRAKDEFAVSGDGSSAVFLYGPRQPVEAQRLYLVRDTGAALVLPPPASKYEEPGYLPEVTVGPRLLLSDDATRLLYTEGATRDEIFLLDVTAATATTHVTSDSNFQPYIGFGILPGFRAVNMLIAVGDPGMVDLYSVTTGGAPVVNLTQTNGNTTPPFTRGNLVPATSTTLDNGTILVSELSPAGLRLRAVDLATSQQTVVLDGLNAPPQLGVGLAPALLLHTNGGDRQLDPGHGAVRLAAPPGLTLGRDASTNGFSMFRVELGAQAAVVFRLTAGGLLVLPTETGLDHAALTNRGVVLAGATVRYYAPDIGVTLTSAPVRFVLSGLDS